MSSEAEGQGPAPGPAEELARARQATVLELRQALQLSEDEQVHQLRQQGKVLRARLRLLRAALGEARYHRLDHLCRDAARPLAEARDAQAVEVALVRLLERCPDLPPGAFDGLRAALAEHHRQAVEQLFTEGGALEQAARALQLAGRSAALEALARAPARGLRRGLARTYRRGRRGLQLVAAQGGDQALHAWRRAAKHLRYQLEALAAPAPAPRAAARLHRLGDLLGQDHDLAVLYQLTSTQLGQACTAAEARLLHTLIDRRRQTLQRRALRLGQRLYARPARPFARRTLRRARH